jgi:myosin-crossreactive antigen
LTFDNGREFSWHEKLAENLDCNTYFTKPYHSWERGLVRTAQMAVYNLFDTDKEVHPMYNSAHNPKYLLRAIKAIHR